MHTPLATLHPRALVVLEDGEVVRLVRFAGSRPVLVCEATAPETRRVVREALDARSYDELIGASAVGVLVQPTLGSRGIAFVEQALDDDDLTGSVSRRAS